MSHYTDIGDGHEISFVFYKDDQRAGMNVRHKTPAGEPCEGFITFEGSAWAKEFSNAVTWKVENWDPLTISPSLLCRCGDHGWIREGKWVRA